MQDLILSVKILNNVLDSVSVCSLQAINYGNF